jgi:hypothetical protein
MKHFRNSFQRADQHVGVLAQHLDRDPRRLRHVGQCRLGVVGDRSEVRGTLDVLAAIGAGSVFTADVDRGYGVAARVRSGTFGVNEGYIMDPAAPFGGVKNSGYGRELGTEGIDSYTVSQSISAAAPVN